MFDKQWLEDLMFKYLTKEDKMVKVEYFNGKDWVYAGGPFINENMAWISLGGDDLNYRTVDSEGKVLTDKSVGEENGTQNKNALW